MYFPDFTTEQLNEIYNDVNATEESIKNDVDYLMKWLEKQPHLPNIKDEFFLTNFLVRCKNSVEKCKKKLDLYYTTRSVIKELYEDRNLHSEKNILCRHYWLNVMMPKPTPELHRVGITRFNELDDKTAITSMDFFKSNQLYMDLNLKMDLNKGYIAIFDTANITMSFVYTIMGGLETYVALNTKLYPTRIQKIYVVNMSSIFAIILRVVKKLMKKKLADRIEIWNKSPTDLPEVIPKYCLPEEYGGTEKPIEELHKDYLEHVLRYQDWLHSEGNVKADLSKRPKDSCSHESQIATFGAAGTFRKLNID